MSTPTWPTFLPFPQRSPHNYKPTDLTMRSQMNGGPPKTRQMFSTGTTTFNISFILKESECALLEGFFAYELARGAREFILPLKSGIGVVNRRVKFVGTPSYDPSLGPKNFNVTATVEALEPLEMDELNYVFTAYPTFINDFDSLINVVAPPIWN